MIEAALIDLALQVYLRRRIRRRDTEQNFGIQISQFEFFQLRALRASAVSHT